jgi:hypothetical protein
VDADPHAPRAMSLTSLKLLARLSLMLLGTVASVVFCAVLLGALFCPIVTSFAGGDCMPWVPDYPLPTRTLLNALPAELTSAQGGWDRFTAAELNRVYPMTSRVRITGPLDFVDSRIASTGPSEVSVNPIDQFTWGAAALSRRHGPCFLILWAADPVQPEYGGAKFGVLPPGAPCVGAAATPETVTASEWPRVRVLQPPLILEGAAFLLIGMAVLGVSHGIALHLIKVTSGFRWPLFIVGSLLVAMGLDPFLIGLQ